MNYQQKIVGLNSEYQYHSIFTMQNKIPTSKHIDPKPNSNEAKPSIIHTIHLHKSITTNTLEAGEPILWLNNLPAQKPKENHTAHEFFRDHLVRRHLKNSSGCSHPNRLKIVGHIGCLLAFARATGKHYRVLF